MRAPSRPTWPGCPRPASASPRPSNCSPRGSRQYLAVSTIFGAGVALLDVIALTILDIRYAWLWGLLAFITNYIPNVGFIIGLIPPTIVALLDHDAKTALAVVIIYCVLNIIIQSVIQPRVVGTTVGLSATLSFLSLIVWARSWAVSAHFSRSPPPCSSRPCSSTSTPTADG